MEFWANYESRTKRSCVSEHGSNFCHTNFVSKIMIEIAAKGRLNHVPAAAETHGAQLLFSITGCKIFGGCSIKAFMKCYRKLL